MEKRIAVLPGEGIGPEVIAQAVKTLRAIEKKFGHHFILTEGLIGAVAIDATGNPFPKETLDLCNSSDAILFGAIGHPKYDNDPQAKVRPEQGLLAMRKQLDLFANIRPVKTYKQLSGASPLKENIVKGIDFVVLRELSSGIYFGEPRGKSHEEAFDTCRYTRKEILRITELAFTYAKARKKKVTLVDKANVLATSQLWREVVAEYAKSHPDITLETMYVDSAAMKLILNPAHFDVILTENLFGDILTDEASVITGSLGMLPSASTGSRISLYEPIHGSFPEAAGKDQANPLATILSAAMMLELSFGLVEESNSINKAVEEAIENNIRTEDIGGSSSCSAVGDYVAARVAS
ncbi:MAG: 3-isopropylmalate dehydrogenase [Bacteroidota bacterium]